MPDGTIDDIIVTASQRFSVAWIGQPQIAVYIEAVMAQVAAAVAAYGQMYNLMGKMMIPTLKPGVNLSKVGKTWNKDFSNLSQLDWITINGKAVRILIDRNSLDDTKVASILQKLSDFGFNIRLLDTTDPKAALARQYISSLDNIVFTDEIGRSGTDLKNKTFVIGYSDQSLDNVSSSFLYSQITHDGYHQWSYDNGLAAAGKDAEVAATAAQINTATIAGITQTEIDYFTAYMNNPAAIDTRVNTPLNAPNP